MVLLILLESTHGTFEILLESTHGIFEIFWYVPVVLSIWYLAHRILVMGPPNFGTYPNFISTSRLVLIYF